MKKTFKILLTIFLYSFFYSCNSVKTNEVNTIPFQFKEDKIGGGTISAECTIAGTKSLCLIDTGANESSASSSISKIKIIGKTKIRGSTGNEIKCNKIIIPNIKTGTLEIDNLNASSCGNNENENMLGMNIFRSKNITFDFISKNITLTHVSLNTTNDLEFSSARHLLIPIELQNIKIMSIWDTGAGLSVIDENVVKEHSTLFTKKFIVNAVDSTGIIKELPVYSAKEILIGNLKLQDVYFLVRDFTATRKNTRDDVKVIIGANIMKSLKWDFDIKNKKWSVSK